jgi:hypothetical protein
MLSDPVGYKELMPTAGGPLKPGFGLSGMFTSQT